MRNVSTLLGIGLLAFALLGCGGDGNGRSASTADARTTCLGNLRAIHQGLTLYSVDNEGTVPTAWQSKMLGYSKVGPTKAFCPSVRPADGNFGYALEDGLVGRRLETVESPDGAAMVFDFDADGTDTTAGYRSPEPGRHTGRNNVVYVGGAAASVEANPPL